MGKRLPSVMGDNRQSLTGRLETIRHLEQISSQGRPIHLISDALIKAGYTLLRRTTSESARCKPVHGLDHREDKTQTRPFECQTTRCILANPDTPVSVRAIIHSILDRKN